MTILQVLIQLLREHPEQDIDIVMCDDIEVSLAREAYRAHRLVGELADSLLRPGRAHCDAHVV